MQEYERLELKFAEWIGKPISSCVACASGTTALHLALESFEFRLGSRILIPEYTMVACARACILAGHEPVPVDCNEHDLLIDTSKLKNRTDGLTRAIMAVHVYGRRCSMEALHRFAKRRELFVIEDMAEAHGVPIHEKSNAACYSFYRNKIIAGEEGGMIYFQDPSHARRARLLRNMGFPTDQSYEHIPRGINGRMSNSHAKLILDSLARVNLNLGKRREIEQWYDKYVPLEYHMPARDVPWVYDLRLRNVNNKPVVSELQKQGIKARLGFLPISAQQEYLGPWKHLVAYEASREVLYLPIETSMTESQVRSIADRLQTAIAKASFQNVDF